jgi:hypothetical protein
MDQTLVHIIQFVIPSDQLPHLRAALDRYAVTYPTDSDFNREAWARVVAQLPQQREGN